jgi:sarcosine oxidase subunit gamma
MSPVSQQSQPRRSPVYRKFASGDTGRASIAAGGNTPVDLSLMPRFGLRGKNAQRWLEDKGLPVPAVNRAEARADGYCVARLGATEFWVLATTELAEQKDMPALTAPEPGCYPVHCGESRAWFALAGEARCGVMAKLCGVDLRPMVFAPGTIVQTSVARVNAAIIFHQLWGMPVFSIFSDTASAEYLWDVLQDAALEFPS